MTQIRTTHRYGYRSGEWADLLDVAPRASDAGDCYVVRFADAVTDFWPVNDPDARYEFRDAPAGLAGKPETRQ